MTSMQTLILVGKRGGAAREHTCAYSILPHTIFSCFYGCADIIQSDHTHTPARTHARTHARASARAHTHTHTHTLSGAKPWFVAHGARMACGKGTGVGGGVACPARATRSGSVRAASGGRTAREAWRGAEWRREGAEPSGRRWGAGIDLETSRLPLRSRAARAHAQAARALARPRARTGGTLVCRARGRWKTHARSAAHSARLLPSFIYFCGTQPPPHGGDQAVMPTQRGRRLPPIPSGWGA